MSTSATKSKPTPTRPRGVKGSKTASASKAKAKRASAKSKTASTKVVNKNGNKRLSPGGLDGLVVDFMKKKRDRLPATAGTVGRGIKRSSGAVSNCLGRLEKAGEVRVTNKKPRKYDLVNPPK
jgi:hypothetical protein